MNCWEFKKCGRESNGDNVAELGICPAYTEAKLNGIHDGKNGGRSCWVIAGTFCGDKIQGTFAEKERNCLACDFYKFVRHEERPKDNFRMSIELVKVLAA